MLCLSDAVHVGSAQSGLKCSEARVVFTEAATVFADPLTMTYPDPDHSREEERLITIGTSEQGQLLIIAHTERDDLIRIISARRVTPKERRLYESGN